MLTTTQLGPPAPNLNDTVADMPSPLAVPSELGPCARLPGEMAHDLNNLLTIIRGNCQLLLGAKATLQFSQDLLREIHLASEQAVLLIEQFQALPDNPRYPAEVKDLRGLVTDSQGLLRGLLGSGVELVLWLYAAPCPVRVVPGQIERILVNLACNARDAMPRGGSFTLALTVLDLKQPLPGPTPLAAGPYALLTISDTGAGLNDHAKAHLFQPFQSTKPGGKGLGLAIIHSLVRQHGGHIDVQSEAGLGTTFHIYLPLALDHAPGVPVMMHATPPPEGSETVLLVEDENAVRSIVLRILEENGYFVLDAANGAEALLMAQTFSYPIHLLITDLAMPKMNGLELVREIAPLHPETRVLFLSGYSDGILPGHEPLDKAVPFLQKPFKTAVLVEKVREVLGKVKS